MIRNANKQVCMYTRLQVCNICNNANMKAYKYASMQEKKYVSIQVCKYASMKV